MCDSVDVIIHSQQQIIALSTNGGLIFASYPFTHHVKVFIINDCINRDDGGWTKQMIVCGQNIPSHFDYYGKACV